MILYMELVRKMLRIFSLLFKYIAVFGIVISCTSDVQVEILPKTGTRSDLDVSNLVIKAVTSDGFSVAIKSSGGTSSAVHKVYFCNRTVSPGCDPLTGSSALMKKLGTNQEAIISGLLNPADNYAIEILSTDVVPVIGLPLSAIQDLDGTPISLSNMVFSRQNLNGLDISVDFSGDNENNATVRAYFCNSTDSPACDPLLGDSVLMSRNASNYTVRITGLNSPNDEGDVLNFSVVAVDPNGTGGSPLLGTDYLADLRLSGLVKSSIVSDGFSVRVNFSEINSNSTVNFYWCNETDSPGCNPLIGNVVPMVRGATTFDVDISGLVAPNNHGDNLSIAIEGIDPDGVVHTTSMTDIFRLTDMELSDLNFYGISQSGFFIDTLISDYNLETNSNLDIKAYWCNDTISPGCDPLVSGNVYSTVGGWHSYGFEITDLVSSPGDTILVAVEINDVDGVYITSSTNASTSEILTASIITPNPKDIFRSVGPGQTSVLASNGTVGGNLTIVGDTATFDNNLLSSNGVGDIIFYGTPAGGGSYDAMAFIHSRTDNRTFTIKNILGTAPTPTVSTSLWKVYRAYTSLGDALIGEENSGIVSDPDLTTFSNFDSWVDGRDISAQSGADENWNFALYAGTQPDIVPAEIKTQWVKDKENTIKVFTVKDPSHVGISQRHQGIWSNTKYRMVISDATALTTHTNTTTIEGLQIELTGSSGGLTGIYSRNNAEGFISHNIIKSTNTGDNLKALSYYDYSQRGVNHTTVFNNLLYDFTTINSIGLYIEWQSQGSKSIRVYNNTFYNNFIAFYNKTYRASYLVNNIFLDSVSLDIDADGTGGLYMANYNIWGDSSIDNHATTSGNPKTGNQKNVISTNLFFNLPGRDFFPMNSNIINSGFDLSSEFTDDIGGTPRDSTYDIGAVEAAGS
ncbi:MAG: hypothetical protein ACJAS4_003550 [Bacteriovoracaceae bacterium]